MSGKAQGKNREQGTVSNVCVMNNVDFNLPGRGPLGVPVGGMISVSLISMGRSAHCGCTLLWLESKDV